MESIKSKITKLLLKAIRFNKIWRLTGPELRQYIEKQQAAADHAPPSAILKQCEIRKAECNNHTYYVMRPFAPSSKKHIFYLHGGGYVHEMSDLHWKFLFKLMNAIGCAITIPIYPLTPNYHCQDVYDFIVPLYRKVAAENKPQDITIMGDSAGGGLSLGLAQNLLETDMQQPGNIVLISPALDCTFGNPEIREIEKLDPILALPALFEIAKWYPGGKDLKHYLISPLYGKIEGLGRISMFMGTHDILYPDARKLKAMADETGIPINYYEYPSMIHVWPLLFFPESKKAVEQIVDLIGA